MKLTVTSENNQDNKIVANVTIDAKDVDVAVKKAYSEIAKKYNFQGFRKGKAPRPVIDSMVGREGVLAQATNELLNNAEPIMLEELNVVPLGEISYGDEPELVKEHEDYVYSATINVRPQCELDSYDAPQINMPPEEATDAEITQQVEQLLSYQATFEDVTDRAVKNDDMVSVLIENVENADSLAGEKIVSVELPGTPQEIRDALAGMKPEQTKEVSFKLPDGSAAKVKITVKSVKVKNIPELTDELVEKSFGFKSVDEFRNALKVDIENDKKNSLPSLKEDRVIEEITKHLKLEETPKEYVDQVFQEIAQDFLGQLQRQGQTLDNFLKVRHITIDQFMSDLRQQAEEHARQSLALDAVALKQNFEATIDDIKAEFKELGMPDVEKSIENFKKNGQLPAIRDSIKRNKALKWLVENAKVNVVDEIAQKREKASK